MAQVVADDYRRNLAGANRTRGMSMTLPPSVSECSMNLGKPAYASLGYSDCNFGPQRSKAFSMTTQAKPEYEQEES